jgi:hypothetical protein
MQLLAENPPDEAGTLIGNPLDDMGLLAENPLDDMEPLAEIEPTTEPRVAALPIAGILDEPEPGTPEPVAPEQTDRHPAAAAEAWEPELPEPNAAEPPEPIAPQPAESIAAKPLEPAASPPPPQPEPIKPAVPAKAKPEPIKPVMPAKAKPEPIKPPSSSALEPVPHGPGPAASPRPLPAPPPSAASPPAAKPLVSLGSLVPKAALAALKNTSSKPAPVAPPRPAAELRAADRISISADVQVTAPATATRGTIRFSTVTRDVSETGLFIMTTESLRGGDLVELAVSISSVDDWSTETYALVGRVVRIADGGYGIHLEKVTDAFTAKVRTLREPTK